MHPTSTITFNFHFYFQQISSFSDVPCFNWSLTLEASLIANPMQEFTKFSAEHLVDMDKMFHDFKENHGKNYDDEFEHRKRKNIFQHNIRYRQLYHQIKFMFFFYRLENSNSLYKLVFVVNLSCLSIFNSLNFL